MADDVEIDDSMDVPAADDPGLAAWFAEQKAKWDSWEALTS